MIRIALLVGLLLAAPAETFTQFTYCRAAPSGTFESLCIRLDPAGVGESQFKRRESDDLKFDIKLSPGGTSQFLNLLAGTKYLANGNAYESKKKVANLGMKNLTLERTDGKREARFNYSEIKEVGALVDFFEALIVQETLAIDLGWAVQFDRLGVPDRLDRLESFVKLGRVSDTKTLIDILDTVSSDEHIVNYARAHAKTLRDKIALIK
jgi:hypothetical protein